MIKNKIKECNAPVPCMGESIGMNDKPVLSLNPRYASGIPEKAGEIIIISPFSPEQQVRQENRSCSFSNYSYFLHRQIS
jgi:hypothetical protein